MNVLYQTILHLNRCNCGKHLSIKGFAVIYRHPNAHISIGDDVTLQGFCILIARDVGEICISDYSILKNRKIITSEQVIL